jgi:hypothetical protein
MQLNINIEDKNLQEQISLYLSEKKQEADEFIIDMIKDFFQKEKAKSLITEEEIKIVVENSQCIEGYTPVSDEVTERVKALMKQHNVQVSF